jgi:hypothetical protein
MKRLLAWILLVATGSASCATGSLETRWQTRSAKRRNGRPTASRRSRTRVVPPWTLSGDSIVGGMN